MVSANNLHRDVAALSDAPGIAWPRNVLRHSFISYRIDMVKSADQVALEAGNSPSIIFKHYRELTTEEKAAEWFAIPPKDGQLENTFLWDKRNAKKVLNGRIILEREMKPQMDADER